VGLLAMGMMMDSAMSEVEVHINLFVSTRLNELVNYGVRLSKSRSPIGVGDDGKEEIVFILKIIFTFNL